MTETVQSTGPVKEQWHLDKRVPVALIIGLIAQAATFVWWAGQTASQLDYDRRDIGRNTVRIERLESANADTRERMIAIEANLKYVGTQLEAMNNQLRVIAANLQRQAQEQKGGR